MAGASPTGAGFERWLSVGAQVVAPVTVISTLLFYFGYVSSREQYLYFGLDVDTIGLSTQDFVMRSPQPLLVPMLVLSILAAGAVGLHGVVRRGIAGALDDPDGGHARRIRRLLRRWLAAGALGVVVGVVMLLAYPRIGDWPPYPLVTPVVLAAGCAVSASALSWHDRSGAAPRVALWIAVAASVFWATATLAQWTGLGLGKDQARNLDELPSVILDTQERLFVRSPNVEERALAVHDDGQEFRYRYRGLRLLIQGDDGMFLVPTTWSASNTTLMVPLDGSVRVQFQFVNEPP